MFLIPSGKKRKFCNLIKSIKKCQKKCFVCRRNLTISSNKQNSWNFVMTTTIVAFMVSNQVLCPFVVFSNIYINKARQGHFLIKVVTPNCKWLQKIVLKIRHCDIILWYCEQVYTCTVFLSSKLSLLLFWSRREPIHHN